MCIRKFLPLLLVSLVISLASCSNTKSEPVKVVVDKTKLSGFIKAHALPPVTKLDIAILRKHANIAIYRDCVLRSYVGLPQLPVCKKVNLDPKDSLK